MAEKKTRKRKTKLLLKAKARGKVAKEKAGEKVEVLTKQQCWMRSRTTRRRWMMMVRVAAKVRVATRAAAVAWRGRLAAKAAFRFAHCCCHIFVV